MAIFTREDKDRVLEKLAEANVALRKARARVQAEDAEDALTAIFEAIELKLAAIDAFPDVPTPEGSVTFGEIYRTCKQVDDWWRDLVRSYRDRWDDGQRRRLELLLWLTRWLLDQFLDKRFSPECVAKLDRLRQRLRELAERLDRGERIEPLEIVSLSKRAHKEKLLFLECLVPGREVRLDFLYADLFFLDVWLEELIELLAGPELRIGWQDDAQRKIAGAEAVKAALERKIREQPEMQ